MAKKINHYKLQSIQKECEEYLKKKTEFLEHCKQMMKEQNHIDGLCKLKELFQQMQIEMMQMKEMKNQMLSKLEQEDYNVSKGVLTLLETQEAEVHTLALSYNEHLQKLTLLIENLSYEEQVSCVEEVEEEEVEEENYFSLIWHFLFRHIKIVIFIVVAIFILFWFKNKAITVGQSVMENVENINRPIFSGELTY